MLVLCAFVMFWGTGNGHAVALAQSFTSAHPCGWGTSAAISMQYIYCLRGHWIHGDYASTGVYVRSDGGRCDSCVVIACNDIYLEKNSLIEVIDTNHTMQF